MKKILLVLALGSTMLLVLGSSANAGKPVQGDWPFCHYIYVPDYCG